MHRHLPSLVLFLGGFCPLILVAAGARGSAYHWRFEPEREGRLFAADDGTPWAVRESDAAYGPERLGGGLVINGAEDVLQIAARLDALPAGLPERELTVSAWVALERTQRQGGIVSCVRDDGDAEQGLVLGYRGEVFSFALATEATDDGDGRLVWLQGKTPMVPGRWHQVTGTYDGERARLWVDGELDAETTEPGGALTLDPGAPFVLGSFRDANEDHPLDGRLLEVEILPVARGVQAVRQDFERRARLTELEPWTDRPFEFLVAPYLTWPTGTAMSVGFETTFPSTAVVTCWRDVDGEDAATELRSGKAKLHTLRLEGLEPDRKYFYRVVAVDGESRRVESEPLSFRTASSPGKAFTFVVVGDTQTNGEVAKRVSDLAWMHRPNLLLHAGDLVDAGTDERDWTDVFFPSMQPLLGRVPMMPVLGNHEQDAELYYRYMSLPEPERWYAFRYGDAEFFMLDGNRSLAERSEQLSWLEGALAASEAKWRFAVLHQPPWTSDADDYGDTRKEDSLRGDPNVRPIVALLEEHGVDLCFSGHVHDYERTFPIRGGQVVPYEEGGVIYVTAAGGGGPLEDFDPTNTWFGHKKARVHHLVYVALHGDWLELQAIDDEGRLFDTLTLHRRP